ncbi:MAG: 23S rRNA (guanosine(2251)-2'-O)-methyltransferase RlmB [Clostridia bacterium]|nr:23S rRNA (guanosine(2251)-2'-O)-methyltransferase RlmB [Clostridia bacterium]
MNIEGKNPVKEALDSNTEISKICVSKTARDLQSIIDEARKKNIRIDFVDKSYLDRISQSGRHQGVVAVSKDFQYCSIEDILQFAKSKGENLFLLILDGIEDPHNLGSIIRVAECSGAHGVIIPSRRSATVNATVLRTSAGAANHMLIASVTNINDAIRKLTDSFVNVYSADMNGKLIYDVNLKEDTAIVIGSEGNGVKQLTSKLCNGAISIPQFGKVNSLNASVACGIICFETVRQRLKLN